MDPRYKKPDLDTISLQLGRVEVHTCMTELEYTTHASERLRRENAQLRLRVCRPPRATEDNQVEWLQEKLANALEAMHGMQAITLEDVQRVFFNGGHFLLRFPSGQLVTEHDPDKAKSYVTHPGRHHILPSEWLIVTREGRLTILSDLPELPKVRAVSKPRKHR